MKALIWLDVVKGTARSWLHAARPALVVLKLATPARTPSCLPPSDLRRLCLPPYTHKDAVQKSIARGEFAPGRMHGMKPRRGGAGPAGSSRLALPHWTGSFEVEGTRSKARCATRRERRIAMQRTQQSSTRPPRFDR